MTTDPRDLGGSIAGPGGPNDQGGVVIDASRALLPTYTEVALVDDTRGRPLAAVEIRGRVNKTTDEASVLILAGPDALAAWVSQLVGLAARAQGSSWRAHRKFAEQFRDDLDRRMKEMP